jgi:hypothetical protein
MRSELLAVEPRDVSGLDECGAVCEETREN